MTVIRPRAGLDSALSRAAQDVWADADLRKGHLRVRTLLTVRWMVIAGEVLLLAAITFGVGNKAPFAIAAAVIASAIAAICGLRVFDSFNTSSATVRRRYSLPSTWLTYRRS
ncbi:MAG: hypothetical protein ACK56C_06800 [Alphaproteobacteria bacterium]